MAWFFAATHIVRAECIVLDDDLVALVGRPVKRAQQEVHVDRERVHHRHLVRRLGADERGGQTGHRLVNVGPRARAAKVALDTARRPLLHFLVQIGLRAQRLQTERVAAEVDAALAVGVAGDAAWESPRGGKQRDGIGAGVRAACNQWGFCKDMRGVRACGAEKRNDKCLA